jgi:CheY-like chemotaxis protein
LDENSANALPEYILLDLNMPILDGFGFVEALQKEASTKSLLPHLKIIIVTSSINPKDIQRAKNLGIEHYLTKPITPAALLKAISPQPS